MIPSFLARLSKDALRHWIAIASHGTVLPSESFPANAQLCALIKPQPRWEDYSSYLLLSSSKASSEDVEHLALVIGAIMKNPLCHLMIDHLKRLVEEQNGREPPLCFLS